MTVRWAHPSCWEKLGLEPACITNDCWKTLPVTHTSALLAIH